MSRDFLFCKCYTNQMSQAIVTINLTYDATRGGRAGISVSGGWQCSLCCGLTIANWRLNQ